MATTDDRFTEELRHDPRVLLGPGPSNLHPRVFRAMASPTLGYLDPEFLAVMDHTMVLLRHLFQTENELSITLPGTRMSGMEAAVCNVVEPGDEVVVGIHGFFGQRIAEIVERHGGTVQRVEVDFGQVLGTDQIASALDAHPDTKMVAVVHGETSVGVGQPLEDIGKLVRERDKLFLVDAVCSIGGAHIPVDDHRLVHEEGYSVHFPRGERPYFLDPRMRLLPDVAPPPQSPSSDLPPEPVEALVRQNRLRGVEPGFLTSAARYKREDDIPLAVFEAALRALEQMGHTGQ